MFVMESLLLIVFLPSLIRVFVFARPGQEGQGTSSGQEGKVEEASITQTGLGPRSHTMNIEMIISEIMMADNQVHSHIFYV